jgi:diadenosine tetraphosphate (Ap4A) HIT family hydrolase
MPNETITGFGYPENVIAEYPHWTVLLRKVQNTAGCLILACNEEAQALPAVSAAAWAEFPKVTADVEGALRAAFAFDKINYLLLMMVDKHVHFHVLPRYAASRRFEGVEFNDAGWPRAPALGEAAVVPDEVFVALRVHLKERWRVSAA